MTIIGRITKDAVVNQLPDERKVLSFSLALNDYYQSKTGELQKVTTYVECAYWRSVQIAGRLTKGALVEITGRLYTKAFISKEGSPKATSHCHVSYIHILGATLFAQFKTTPVFDRTTLFILPSLSKVSSSIHISRNNSFRSGCAIR
jgi:single-strand DNA-binding protein